MTNPEQAPVIKPETKEQRRDRIGKEVLESFRDARLLGKNAPTPKKEGLDYYDNLEEKKKDDADVPSEINFE